MRFRWGVLLLLILPNWLAAQVYTAKYSNEFLSIGVGARASAMGNCQTAIAEDATAGYWNPASLTNVTNAYDISLMHSEYFAGIAKYDFGAFAVRIDSLRRIAGSVIRFGVDDIPNTLNFKDGNSFDYARITSFSVADLALFISYAQLIPQVPGLSVGGNFKLINRTVGQFASAWGFGLDAAIAYRRKNLYLGANLSDVTSTFNAWSYNTATFDSAFVATGNAIPKNSIELTLPALHLGAAYRFFAHRRVSVLYDIDLDIHSDGKRNVIANAGRFSFDPKMAIEIAYKRLVFLRGGLMNLQKINSLTGGGADFSVYPTAGLGINLPIAHYTLQLDYALSNLSGFQQSLYSNVVSLRFGFDRLKF